MTEKCYSDNKPINKEGNEPEENPLDGDRRAVIKKAACVIGAAYIAPVTLNLLLADKANALSLIGPPPPPPPGP
jgi:hypothetical protein